MRRYLLAFALSIPLSGHCQSYADSPFYKRVSVVPSTARTEGWAPWRMPGLPFVLEGSHLMAWSSPDSEGVRGGELTNAWIDENGSAHIFHFFLQYYRLNVAFGYNLRVEAVQGTDEIRCTFSALTDPDEIPDKAWRRNKAIPVVPLSPDLTPVVIKSGDAIAVTTLPLGPGRIEVVHYIRLTRTDLPPDAAQ